MWKLGKNKKNDEKGIAIMFSLIMLMVFFILAFGFVSMASSANDAAKAREPKQNADLSATQTILNEALFCIEEGLYAGSELAEQALFLDLNFTNSSESVDLQAWGTNSGDQASLEDGLLLQFDPEGSALGHTELKIDTGDSNFSNFGWLEKDEDGDGTPDYKYAWMVIESNGVDPNYLGNGVAAAKKIGKYTRELDLANLDTTNNNTIHNDWSISPWESKKTLIEALASNYETAVAILQTNTTPIRLADETSKYDLTSITNTTTVSDLLGNIAWLNNGSDTQIKSQVAANILDYIDDDNECTFDAGTGVYGVERTPQINEVAISILNATDVPSDTDSDGDIDPTTSTVAIRCQGEWANIINAAAGAGSWGSTPVDGSSCKLEIELTISAIREDSSDGSTENAFSDTPATIVVEDITTLGGFAGAYASSYTIDNAKAIVTKVTGTDSKKDAELKNLNVTITKITYYGDNAATTIWDVATPGSAAKTSNYDLEEGKEASIAFQCKDPRNNHTGWETVGGWIEPASTTDILNSKNARNSNYSPGGWSDEETVVDPNALSTSYMPEGGGITTLDELGLISRGEIGKTINLVDYNIKEPTKIGNYSPAVGVKLDDPTSFDGGDRSLLDYVRITGGQSYKQYSPVNPNTTNPITINFLLSGIPCANPSLTISQANIDQVIDRFPGIWSSDADYAFLIEHFHNTSGNFSHTRNPKTYGYPFSKFTTRYSTVSDTLKDAEREALVIKTMNLTSPKYSYYTVLTAVKDISSGSVTSSVYNFVRRDNESGSYKLLKQITK